jgi:hypothetical protein
MGMPTCVDRVYLRRRLTAALVLVALIVAVGVVLGAGGDSPPAAEPKATPTPRPLAELPGGGRTIFPGRRIVAFYGNPADDELGALGIGSPRSAGRRLLAQAKAYDRPRRKVLPVMELLADVANADPGDDGLYRRQETDRVIGRYLRAARRIDALLVLDLQPGRAAFLPEVKRLGRWLRQPDVGLALDPEWHVRAPDVPGQVIGSVEGADVEAVAAWLDDLTGRLQLPQKLFIVHQFTDDMVRDKQLLRPKRHLATVLNADGFGTAPVKISKYREFTDGAPWTFDGFKLFYREDVGLMSPRQVLRLRPAPDVVVYE